MTNQIPIVVSPLFGGNTGLDIAALKAQMEQGYKVVTGFESSNGAILLILEPPTAPADNGS